MKRLFLAVALMILCLSAAPVQAAAIDIFKGVNCNKSGAGSSAVCSSKTGQDPIAGENGALAEAITIVAIVAGFAAIILLIVGGIRYITSGGDASKIASAKNTVINALIGLAIIVLAQTLITFVIKRI